MTTIVIAALSLLVLVILILIFTGRMSLFSGGVDESNACSNYCKSLGKELSTGTPVEIPKTGTAPTNKCGKSTDTHIPGVIYDKDNKDNYCCCQDKTDNDGFNL